MLKLMLIYLLATLFPLFRFSIAETELKLLDYKTTFANKSYVNADPGKLRIIKVNETYSRLYIKAEIIKEFPLDTQFDVSVTRYNGNEKSSPPEKVGEFTTFICHKNDPNREYLPYNILDMSRIDGKNCVQKGDYEYDDAGVFKFYEIVPLEQGYYYKSVNVIRAGDITISTTRVKSKAIDVDNVVT